MKPRLPDVPVLKSLSGAVGAATYNRVLRLFSRSGAPQELVLGSRGLHFRFDRELWLCVDRRLNDTPIIAWSKFESRRRVGIHAPVECRVLYYHAYARVIELTVLNEVDRRLEAALAEEREGGPVPRGPKVVWMHRDER